MLLTRAPLYSARRLFAFDLHVLGAPPTFALSQDQTLQLKLEKVLPALRKRINRFAWNYLQKRNRLEKPPSRSDESYSVFRDRAKIPKAASFRGRRVCPLQPALSNAFFLRVRGNLNPRCTLVAGACQSVRRAYREPRGGGQPEKTLSIIFSSDHASHGND